MLLSTKEYFMDKNILNNPNAIGERGELCNKPMSAFDVFPEKECLFLISSLEIINRFESGNDLSSGFNVCNELIHGLVSKR